MTTETDKKLTKREFDTAVNRLYTDLERPVSSLIKLGELERGGRRDYHEMQQSFELNNRMFGLPMWLRGTVRMNKERDAIRLTASLRYKTERNERNAQDAELWGEYNVYEGRWTLRWL